MLQGKASGVRGTQVTIHRKQVQQILLFMEQLVSSTDGEVYMGA